MSPRAGLDTATVVAAAARMSDAGDELSLSALAQMLGVRTPSLYNHVDGIAGLQRELALRGVRELTAQILRAAIGRSGREALFEIAQSYRAYVHAHPGLYRFTQPAPASADVELQAASAELIDILSAVLSGFNLHDDDALHAIRGLRSLLHGFAMLELDAGFGIDLDLDVSFDFALDAFIAGLERDARVD